MEAGCGIASVAGSTPVASALRKTPHEREIAMKEECISCEHEFEMKIKEGKSGKCPNCNKEYTIDYVDGDDDLRILWFTGININDLEDKDEADDLTAT